MIRKLDIYIVLVFAFQGKGLSTHISFNIQGLVSEEETKWWYFPTIDAFSLQLYRRCSSRSQDGMHTTEYIVSSPSPPPSFFFFLFTNYANVVLYGCDPLCTTTIISRPEFWAIFIYVLSFFRMWLET